MSNGPTLVRRRPVDLSAYRDAPLTYPEVGATREGPMPEGYRVLDQHTEVGRGEPAFNALASALMAWDLQRTIGLRVSASAPSPVAGATVVSVLPLGPVGLLVPCRVVYTLQEPRRVGFGYGSLPGHPLIGEERFSAECTNDGRVMLRITSFSRPAGLARLAPPLANAGQMAINRRYARAGVRLARGSSPRGRDR